MFVLKIFIDTPHFMQYNVHLLVINDKREQAKKPGL